MDVVREGQAANVPIAPYNDVPAIFDSDAVTKRQNFQETELQGLGKMRAFVAPYKFPESPLRIGRGIGEAGCDNAKYFGRSAVPSGTGAVA